MGSEARMRAALQDGYKVHQNPDGSFVFIEPARAISALWSRRDSRVLNAWWRDHGIKYGAWREELCGLEWCEEVHRPYRFWHRKKCCTLT